MSTELLNLLKIIKFICQKYYTNIFCDSLNNGMSLAINGNLFGRSSNA